MRLVLMVLVLAGLFAVLADFEPNRLDSQLRILDMPVVSIRQVDAFGWLALGQTASGVLVLAQGGLGVVTFAQGGVGVLFGAGQGMVSLVVPVAQIGGGLFYFTGQLGVGLQARGQLVGLRKAKDHFASIHAELDAWLK